MQVETICEVNDRRHRQRLCVILAPIDLLKTGVFVIYYSHLKPCSLFSEVSNGSDQLIMVEQVGVEKER